MRRCLLLVSLSVLTTLCGDWPLVVADELRVQKTVSDKFTLEVFDNSLTLSQALAINATGQIIGVREVANEAGTQLSQQPFFIDGQQMTMIPLLEGYSNLEICALSDSGLVIGYASRELGHPQGSLTGFVWDSKTGQMTRLMPADQDVSCHAQAISADGTRITGYTNGSQPSRMLPCLWTWNANENAWTVETLDTVTDLNPYIMSSNVLISPDGQRIVACITVAKLAAHIYDSSLYQWTLVDGQWQRELISDEQMHLRGINNAGQIAASITTSEGRQPCIIDAAGKITLIDLLPGDISGEARGINATGTVVGFSDDPPGPEGGPQAFAWSQGTTAPLALPSGTTASMAFGINDAGQIAGLLDVARGVLASQSRPGSKTDSDTAADLNDSTVGDELSVQTLAFRWTPKS